MNKTRTGATLLGAALGITLLATPASATSEQEQEAGIASNPPICVMDTSTPTHHYGHYRGHTAIPSTTQVTSSGLEAQCILAYWSQYIDIPHPGPYDGIFGPRSQASMLAFQEWANDQNDAGLDQDGLPGPQSWPVLRGAH